MSATIINLIIQLIAGAIGGNTVGATANNLSLGAPEGIRSPGLWVESLAGRCSLRLFRCWREGRMASILVHSLVN